MIAGSRRLNPAFWKMEIYIRGPVTAAESRVVEGGPQPQARASWRGGAEQFRQNQSRVNPSSRMGRHVACRLRPPLVASPVLGPDSVSRLQQMMEPPRPSGLAVPFSHRSGEHHGPSVATAQPRAVQADKCWAPGDPGISRPIGACGCPPKHMRQSPCKRQDSSFSALVLLSLALPVSLSLSLSLAAHLLMTIGLPHHWATLCLFQSITRVAHPNAPAALPEWDGNRGSCV